MEEGGQETEKVSEQRRCHGKKSVTDEVDRVATLMFQLGELPPTIVIRFSNIGRLLLIGQLLLERMW